MRTSHRWILRSVAILLCVLTVFVRDWGGEGFFDWGNWLAVIPFLLAIAIFNRTRKRI
jgi:hypothetical protein